MEMARRVREVDSGSAAQVMGGAEMMRMITVGYCGVVRCSLVFVLVRSVVGIGLVI